MCPLLRCSGALLSSHMRANCSIAFASPETPVCVQHTNKIKFHNASFAGLAFKGVLCN